MLGVRSAGSPGDRESGVQGIQGAGSPGCRESGVQGVRGAGSPECRESRVLEACRSVRVLCWGPSGSCSGLSMDVGTPDMMDLNKMMLISNDLANQMM